MIGSKTFSMEQIEEAMEEELTVCPHCGEVNEYAEEDGFVEGDREYHAKCWSLVRGGMDI